MTNKEIAKTFQELADIMELHQENPFKIKTYLNAYIALRKVQTPLAEMSLEELTEIKGVGKAVSEKIQELIKNGTLEALRHYQQLTPPGVVEMLKIKGFGPKKVLTVWKELGIDTIGELLYACNENRLIELYGFGKKTQEEIKKNLEYYQRSKNKLLYADAISIAEALSFFLKEKLEGVEIALVGELRRKSPVVSKMECLIGLDAAFEAVFDTSAYTIIQQQANECIVSTPDVSNIFVYKCSPAEWGSKLFRYTGSQDFMKAFLERTAVQDFKNIATEAAVFEKAGFEYTLPELRENGLYIKNKGLSDMPELIEMTDIKGVIHNHTTYSDGIHTLKDMALQAKSLGYAYIVITDHSKSAFYANGLREDRLAEQWLEIDQINPELAPFKIFKGIESDILHDGSLDYSDDVLGKFDCIIASIHSNLRMTLEIATERLISAIENPHTKILGHPTGRLLLSREGYPIDHQKVIDACAANGVAIELNANPYRLDLDYTWIPYAMEKGVLIAINPDAHSKEGINDIRFGVLAARKGALTREFCLNSMDLPTFEAWLSRH